MSTIKYAAILNTKKKDRILEEFIINTSCEFEIEIKRIIPFFLKYNLGIDERKKIISKGSGIWLAIQAENKILYIALIDKNITEVWGYQFLAEVRTEVTNSLGPEFHKQKPKTIQKIFQKTFAGTIKKFNEVFSQEVPSDATNAQTGPMVNVGISTEGQPKMKVSNTAPSFF
jgi:hypothetical protein